MTEVRLVQDKMVPCAFWIFKYEGDQWVRKGYAPIIGRK